MENLNLLEVKKDFDNYLKDYENLKGKDLIYKGIEELLDNSELREKLFNECLEESKELIEYGEWDNDMFNFIFSDRIDIKVMDWFFDKLVNNLLEKGFKFELEDEWEVIWYNNNNVLNKKGEEFLYKELYSYGVICELWGIDYDTDVRELISERLDRFIIDKYKEE